MDPEHAVSHIPAPSTSESAPLDPKALVTEMVTAGEWPDPELLAKIVQTGDAATKPLIAVLRTYPHGWPAEAPLYYAIGLLSVLRPSRAIPDLIEIVKRYPSDSGGLAASAVGKYGAAGFESLQEILRDPAFRGYNRLHALDAAWVAAGNDATLRSQLAELLRFWLADAIERGRDEVRQGNTQRDHEKPRTDRDSETTRLDESETVSEDSGVPAPDVELTGDKEKLELGLHEEIAFLIGDLANLADPSARALIKTAFDENLVDRSVTDEEFVDEQYHLGGDYPPPGRDWLTGYRVQYQARIDYRDRPPAHPLIELAPLARSQAKLEVAPPPPLPETIRNVGPKLGRNDPCWCGSGKKYKKCHFGKDNVR